MKGSITASCGHTLADDQDGVFVTYGGETCDAVDGFSRCVTYAEFCPACAEGWRAKGWLLNSEAEEDAYLDGGVVLHTGRVDRKRVRRLRVTDGR